MSSEIDALFDDDLPVPVPVTVTLEYYSDLPWYRDLLQCRACPCREEAQRVVPGEGPLTATIAFLGRNPGTQEDKSGSPFVGKAGTELNEWLNVLGMSRQKVLIANVVKCATIEDRAPAAKEVQICATKWLALELLAFPLVRVLVTLGDEATRFVLGVHAPSMSKLAFTPIHVEFDQQPGRKLLVFPVVHPAYILRKPSARSEVFALLKRIADYLQVHEAAAYAGARA